MCRSFSYLGSPVTLAELIFQGETSFVGQTTKARLINMTNLAGAGFAVWDPTSPDPHLPLLYRTTSPAVLDRNLAQLAGKLRAESLIALLRGVAESPNASISDDNTHPFSLPGSPLVMVHNGELDRFSSMRYQLLPFLKPTLAERIRGATDSEWIYHLILSQLSDLVSPSLDEMMCAVQRSIDILGEVRAKNRIRTSSPFNIVFGHGEALVATRYTFDAGNFPDGVPQGLDAEMLTSLTLFYSTDVHPGGVTLASEPTNTNHDQWIAIPPAHLITLSRHPRLDIRIKPMRGTA